jgi:hypothetical protein
VPLSPVISTVASLPASFHLDGIKRAIEAAGVEFVAENGGGCGVRLAKRRRKGR